MMTGQQTHAVLGSDQGLRFLRVCFWVGIVADLLATVPLLFPEVARLMFGLAAAPGDDAYLYVSRIAASLMLGWTFLLAWGSRRPLERKGVILLTVMPVLVGLLWASVQAVQSGFIQVGYMLPLWILYALFIPACVMGYVMAAHIDARNAT